MVELTKIKFEDEQGKEFTFNIPNKNRIKYSFPPILPLTCSEPCVPTHCILSHSRNQSDSSGSA